MRISYLAALIGILIAPLANAEDTFKKLPKKNREYVKETQTTVTKNELAVGGIAALGGNFTAYLMNHVEGDTHSAVENYFRTRIEKREAANHYEISKKRRSDLWKTKILSSAQRRELSDLNTEITRHEKNKVRGFYDMQIKKARNQIFDRAVTRSLFRGIGPVILVDGAMRGILLMNNYDPKISPLASWAADVAVPDGKNKPAK